MTETKTDTAPEAEQEAKEPIPHKITEEKRLPGSILSLSVEIAEEVVTGRIESVLVEFKREAAIPGFRKGKAPMELVRRRLSKAARGESVSRIVPECGQQILDAREIKGLAEPRIENLKAEEGSPITFDLQVEVAPEIELPDLSEIEISIEENPVTDEFVEDQIERLRQANAVLTPKDGKLAKGDAVVVDVEVVDHTGAKVGHLTQANHTVRTGDEHPGLPPEVIKALTGKKAGDSVEVEAKATVPGESEEDEGKEVSWTWKVAVKEVKTVALPDLDDEFAKDLGEFESIDNLRTRIRTDLEKSEEERQRDAAVNAALGELLNKTTFDAPVSLVAAAQYQTLARDSQYLQSMGMSFKDLNEETQGYFESTRREAEARVRADLLLDKIGEQGKIEVTDADVDAEVEKMAERAGRKPLAIRAQLEAKKQLDALRDQIQRRKTAEHLLSQVKIKREKATAAPKKAAKPKAKPKPKTKKSD